MKIILALFVIIGLSLSGCAAGTQVPAVHLLDPSQAANPSPVVVQARPRIALVMKTLTNPFFVEMEKGAREAEKSLDIELIVKTAAQETSIEQQISIVEDLIAEQVDAIVIAPGDSQNLIPVLKKAQDAGIIVINIDNRLDEQYASEQGLKPVPFISVNNEQGAYLAAKVITERITSPAQAAILEGIREARNAQERKAGALRAFGENPYIQLVAVETAHWKIDEGYQLTRTLLNKYPNLRIIFCANDMIALGALKAIQESGRANMLVAGFDALAEAEQAIRDGGLQATVNQQAGNQGYMGVLYARRALRGEELPMETMLDVVVITQANVAP